MLIDTNKNFYFDSRNLRSVPDCLLFETALKNIVFETVAEFQNFGNDISKNPSFKKCDR